MSCLRRRRRRRRRRRKRKEEEEEEEGDIYIEREREREREGSFHQKIGLKLKEETSKVLGAQDCVVMKIGHCGK